MNFVTPPNLFVYFECWNSEPTSKRLMKGFRVIWHATIWSIWKVRNARIFKNQFKEFNEISTKSKWCLSFGFWIGSRFWSCLYYECDWNPRECLKRKWSEVRFAICWELVGRFFPVLYSRSGELVCGLLRVGWSCLYYGCFYWNKIMLLKKNGK